MESWQIDYIERNLHVLIERTFVTEALKATLYSQGLLSHEEVQILSAAQSRYVQSSQLYEILETRTNGYNGLLTALIENRQTGAYSILQSGLDNQAISPENLSRVYSLPVHFHNTVRPLQEVFPSFNEEDAKELIGLEGVRTELNEFVVHDNKVLRLDRVLPTVNSLYVPRFISNRPTLHTTKPMHLVRKQGACFFLERSTQVTDVIRDNIVDGIRSEDAFISENGFAEMLQYETNSSSSSNTFILSDAAGMGKTWFMQNLALKVNQTSQNVCTIYIQLPILSKMLNNTENLERQQDELEYFFGLVYDSKLVAHLLTKHGVKKGMKLFLFMDEFDAVSSTEMNALLTLLKRFQRIENIRLIISTRIYMRRRLEMVFGTISYEFLPLRKREQVDLIVQHWENNVPNSDSEQLKIYADQCIESFAKRNPDILGTPIKCFMFAVIHEDKVRQLSALNCWSQQDFDANYSLVQFYKMYIDISINKSEADDIRNILISYCTRKAVSTLIPDSLKADQLQEIIRVEIQQAAVIERVGFLEHNTSAAGGSTFTDRGVAEFITAQLVVDFLSGVQSPYNCIPVGDFNICETLLQTFSNSMRAINGVCLDGFLVKVKISSFHHSAILEYINQLFIYDTYCVEVFPDSLLSFLQENLFTVVIASIEANFGNLLNLVQSLLKQTSSQYRLPSLLVVPKDLLVKPVMCLSSAYDNWIETNRKIASAAYVLYQIATKGTSHMAEAVFELFSSENYNFFQEISDQFPADWPLPIDVAIRNNNLDVIKYLVGKISLDGRTLRSCLTGNNMPEAEVKIRKIACDEVINQNSLIVTDFYKSIGDDMHMSEYNINILSYVCLNHKLDLKDLSIKTKQRIIDAALLCYNDAQFITLLLLLFASSDAVTDFINSNKTITVFSESITSQRFDIVGARMALNEVKCEKYDYLFEINDIQTLKLLLKIYDDFSSTNSYQRNLLHISVSECKLDWIKVLLRDKRFNINQEDKQGNTPLLCINAWNPIEITKLLIENDANIYAVNAKLQNVAHVLLQHYSDPDSTFIAWTKMLLEMGHEKLWHQQDADEKTPVDMMVKKWGHKNPFPLISHLIQMKTEPKPNRLGQGYSNKFQQLLQFLVPKV